MILPAYMGYQQGGEGWAAELNANGDANMASYGTWLAGTQFTVEDNPNVIWVMGGDCYPEYTFDLTSEYNALANAILAENSNAIISAHSAPGRSSLDDYDQPWLNFNWTYLYPNDGRPQGIRDEYLATDGAGETAMATFWGEGHYENEHGTSDTSLRSQIY